MSHVLITQIGKPLGNFGEYEETTYRFGESTFTTPMISYGLVQALSPDQVVFLGTSGSAWSSLISMSDAIEGADDIYLSLNEKESADAISDADLTELAAILSRSLNCQAHCRVIPYLESNPVVDSAAYLQKVSETITPGDEITLDITHGLRYHPMLALVAAQYLRVTLKANIRGIYYGNHERRDIDGCSPVLSLDGMLGILDWVSALNSFDKDGDYSVFADLMAQDGVEPALCKTIQQAGYYERTSNATKAKEQLTLLRQHQFSAENTPLTHLFDHSLRARTEWSGKQGRGNNEFRLAELYLERADYLRAALYAQEGFISKGLELNRENLNDFDSRSEYNKACDLQAYKDLRSLRNAMAHGVASSDKKTLKILQDQEVLRARLKKLIQQLQQRA
ncbi:MAG: TIGR02221 family CRISPR-associated protein [Amphritea sp.]